MSVIPVKSYRDLTVWQKSMDLVVEVYKIVEQLPKSENYVLSSQMRRAAISIPSNIAEGSYRSTKKDYRLFLIRAFSSGAELETQIEILKKLTFGKDIDCSKANPLLSEVMKMLNKMTSTLNEL